MKVQQGISDDAVINTLHMKAQQDILDEKLAHELVIDKTEVDPDKILPDISEALDTEKEITNILYSEVEQEEILPDISEALDTKVNTKVLEKFLNLKQENLELKNLAQRGSNTGHFVWLSLLVGLLFIILLLSPFFSFGMAYYL